MGAPLVTKVRVVPRGDHADMWIWTRGGLSGHITVALSDAHAMLRRLSATDVEWRRPNEAKVEP